MIRECGMRPRKDEKRKREEISVKVHCGSKYIIVITLLYLYAIFLVRKLSRYSNINK